ncbi:hypothetical protein Efla_004751 [Eimeria flavescens]
MEDRNGIFCPFPLLFPGEANAAVEKALRRHACMRMHACDGSLARRCLLPAGTHCLVLLRQGGIPSGERNKKLQQLFGENSAVRKLKFGVVDTLKRSLKLHDAAALERLPAATETQMVCFVNITPKETVEELIVLRKKDDATRHTFIVRVFQGLSLVFPTSRTFADAEAVVAFAVACSVGAEGAEGFARMQRSPTMVKA